MKVSRKQADANREMIIESAGRLFRQQGFDGVGIAEIMREIGLSHGGFYGHFESKEDLRVEACERALEKSSEKWAERAAKSPDSPLAGLIDPYLSTKHRDDPGNGCLYAGVGLDVARQDNPRLRRSFTRGFETLVGLLSSVLPGRSKAAQREKAIATFSAMVGAMVLARAVHDPILSEEILNANRAVLGGTRGGASQGRQAADQ
ncbi:MAG: TetR family transcriptional regulator [Gemmatimonas sp.]|nr:TetR family transcriptional regulator [Gemmatimonas sp.]